VRATTKWAVPVLGLLLAVLTWRDIVFSPIPGLDPSWHAALHMAARRRMHFGDELVFTFGPLGFLTQPVVYYSSTGLLSALYVFGLQIALCTSLVSLLRRTMALPLAAILTFLVVSAGRELKVAETVVVVAVLVAFGLLRGDHSPRTERILVVAAGVAAGTHLLVKFNTGVLVTVAGLVAVWFAGFAGWRTWRSEAVFLGTATVSLLAGWLLTGNSLGDLVAYVDGSLQVASGYSESLGIDLEERDWFYAAAVGVTLVVLALGSWGSRRWPLGRRIGLGLVGGAFLYAALKHGFVRHDEHDIVFFGEALLVGTALGAGTRRLLAAGGAAAMLVVYLLAAEVPVKEVVNPLPALRRAGDDAATFASPGRRSRAIEASRAGLRDAYALAPGTLALLEGRTVHVRPWEAQVAWAYPEVRWRPVPVFQEYSAYTPDLDRIDADFLSGPRAPERILYEEVFIDFRNPDWESPAATLALVCHYRRLATQPRWQILAHAGDRCGEERPLGTVFARVGDTVPLPDAGDPNAIVVARVRGLADSPAYALRSTLLRIPKVHVHLDDDRRYRLVPSTASNGLIVRSPAVLGFDEPFAPGSATTLRVEHGGGFGLSSTVTIEFVAIPVVN
jgi:hypothetical protein